MPDLIDPILRKKIEEYQRKQPTPFVPGEEYYIPPTKQPIIPSWMQKPPPLAAQILGPAGYAIPWGLEQAEKLFTGAGAALTAPFRPLPEGYKPFEAKADWRAPVYPTSFMPGGAQYETYKQWKGGPTEPYIPLGIPSWAQWGGMLGLGEKPETYKPARMGMGDIAELAPWMFVGGPAGGRVATKAGEMLEARTPQIVKTALEKEAGMARLPRRLEYQHWIEPPVIGKRIKEIERLLKTEGKLPKGEGTKSQLEIELAKLEAQREVSRTQTLGQLDEAIRGVETELGNRSMPFHGGAQNLYPEKTTKQLDEMLKVYNEAREMGVLTTKVPSVKPPVTPKAIPKAMPEVTPPVTPVTPQPVAAINKMLDILKVEKPALRETRALRHEELQRRAAMMGKAIAEGEPEVALARAAKLRGGKLPTAEGALREQFTTGEASQLFGAIRDSGLRVYEKARAYDAFSKLLLTRSPLQKSEIKLLGDVFGPEFVSRFDTLGRKIVKILLDIANLPRAIIASGELSGTLRQGGILLARRPNLAPRMVWEQIKAFFSKKSLRELDDAIRADPDFVLFNEAGGYMAPLPGKATQLWKAEEAYMTRFARHIPVVRESERAYIAGLNLLRFEFFKRSKKLFEKMGATSDEDFRGLTKLINCASGRGEWKFLRGDAGPIANALFFSARLQLSKIQMPTLLFHKSAAVRKEAWRTLIQFLGFGTGILSMAKLAGAEVGIDPRSAEFGKMKIGETRIDIWTGFVQYARFLAQLTSAQREQETGAVIKLNRFQVAKRFLQSKLSPAAGFLNDLFEGTTYMGEEMSFETESLRRQAYNRLMPMFWQDMVDAISEEGLMGGLLASPGLLGVGVITYRPRGAPIIGKPGKPPEQLLEEQVWAQYPQYKQIADRIRELERTDPIAARKLQRQYPQILNIRRQIALAQAQGQQATTDRQKALEQAMKQREVALAGIG